MLEGLRVIELATYIAAPSAGMLLSEWGADVIKVEPPEGCPMRGVFSGLLRDDLSGNPVFDLDNRGKRSVVLDLKQPAGIEALRLLLGGADVFLTNMRPAALEKLKLDYSSLKDGFPSLIYASVTGYGHAGPDRGRPGFDISAFFARSGLTHASTRKGEEPVPPRMGVGDHITGVGTAAGILAALHARSRSGKGAMIDASLLRAGIYALGADTAIQLKFGRMSSTKTRHQIFHPFSNYFRTRDGRWLVIVPRQGAKEWQRLCMGVGAKDLAADTRFHTPGGRRAHAAEAVERLDRIFAAGDFEEWEDRLDKADIVWAPVLRPADVAGDAQAEAAGAFREMREPGGSGATYRTVCGPVRFEGPDAPPAQEVFPASPELGRDTLAVLAEAGMSQAELDKRRKAGVFGKTPA